MHDWINPFQPSVTFHIETSHLICSAKQITGFYMKYNTGLKELSFLSSHVNMTLNLSIFVGTVSLDIYH